jgi:hypothetical protein
MVSGISESGARYWMLLMHDAAVITMERHGKYYDITVMSGSFITTILKDNQENIYDHYALLDIFIYITVYYSGMFSHTRKNNNEKKKTKRIGT